MKTQIVRLLDSGCALTGHRFGCRLAYWSERLDGRWDTGEWGPFRSVKIERVRTELADCQRTIRALDDLVQDLRMYAEQDACEIERLRVERDRWRKIADDFAEAGSKRSAHRIVADDYEEARRD